MSRICLLSQIGYFWTIHLLIWINKLTMVWIRSLFNYLVIAKEGLWWMLVWRPLILSIWVLGSDLYICYFMECTVGQITGHFVNGLCPLLPHGWWVHAAVSLKNSWQALRETQFPFYAVILSSHSWGGGDKIEEYMWKCYLRMRSFYKALWGFCVFHYLCSTCYVLSIILRFNNSEK